MIRGRARLRLLTLVGMVAMLVVSGGVQARALDSAARPPGLSGARPPGLRPGDKAPSFSLKTVDGAGSRTLEELQRAAPSGGVVLVFLSCRCPYVAQARRTLADLTKQYGAQVAFAGINANQSEPDEDVRADAGRNFDFPVLRDDGAKVADEYQAVRTPEVFVVDGKGTIRYHGGVAELGLALADLLAGRAVAKPETKAFGCTIKRKS